MKNIIFCGSYIPKEESFRIRNPQEASNNFQYEFIEKLKMHSNVHVLSYICFPVDNENILLTAMKQNGLIGIIKSGNIIHTYIQYYKAFNTLLHESIDKVIIYNMNYMYSFIWLICKLKRIKSSIIIADYTPPLEETSLLSKVKALICGLQLHDFDEQIILSPELYKTFKGKKSILLQGGVNPKKYETFKQSTIKSKIRLVFSGALERSTGIDNLVKCMRKIENKNLELIISGNGSLRHLVEEAAERDCRIKYCGFLSETEYIQLLSDANILINPRNMALLQSKNNFPSKILEYLATGRPIISTKFSGYEYFKDHMLFYDETENDFAEKLKIIVNNFEKYSKLSFYNNREFIKEFYWDNQIRKVIN